MMFGETGLAWEICTRCQHSIVHTSNTGYHISSQQPFYVSCLRVLYKFTIDGTFVNEEKLLLSACFKGTSTWIVSFQSQNKSAYAYHLQSFADSV